MEFSKRLINSISISSIYDIQYQHEGILAVALENLPVHLPSCSFYSFVPLKPVTSFGVFKTVNILRNIFSIRPLWGYENALLQILEIAPKVSGFIRQFEDNVTDESSLPKILLYGPPSPF